MSNRGYIQVYTGNGKGKTTAALGLALRAAGRGKIIKIIQFMKKTFYGELETIKKSLQNNITIEQYGLENFHSSKDEITAAEREEALRAMRAAEEVLKKNQADILILDEIIVTAYFKIISEDEVIKLMELKPEKMELILTGRYASEEIIKRADLVTEMKEIKHYYQTGVVARIGIEK
jgi:cob(I)alamin adenosyltransferase